jgi:hypothetical protein
MQMNLFLPREIQPCGKWAHSTRLQPLACLRSQGRLLPIILNGLAIGKNPQAEACAA